jgi:hypothetical protein
MQIYTRKRTSYPPSKYIRTNFIITLTNVLHTREHRTTVLQLVNVRYHFNLGEETPAAAEDALKALQVVEEGLEARSKGLPTSEGSEGELVSAVLERLRFRKAMYSAHVKLCKVKELSVHLPARQLLRSPTCHLSVYVPACFTAILTRKLVAEFTWLQEAAHPRSSNHHQCEQNPSPRQP